GDDRLKAEGTGVWATAYASLSLEVGKRYRLTASIDLGSNLARVKYMVKNPSDGTFMFINNTKVDADIDVEFIATTTTADIIFQRADATSTNLLFYLDNVKVEEIGESYRYGFGSHEKDDEIAGSGNHLSFGDYGYSPRIGRRWNIDPVGKPWMSSYHAFSNSPIWKIDPNGAEDGVFPTGEKLEKQGNKTVTDKKFFAKTLKNAAGKEYTQTYCNFGLRNILNASGDHSLDGLNANQIGYKLRNEEGFAKEVTPEEALKYANQGVTVIASYMKEGYTPENNSKFSSGHVAIVAPGEKLSRAGSWGAKNEDYKKGVPKVYNVGPSAYHGLVNLGSAIGHKKKELSGLYVMSADLVKLKAKENKSITKPKSPSVSGIDKFSKNQY
ncbi:MAG: hypothetical protein U9R42_09595, partial [Bacteroidota bacterium]|nr:hypothetical protein [Bacteroidota bacterium]